MGQTPDNMNAFDPFGTMRSMRDAYVEAWSKTMLELVNSQEYADAVGKQLDSYLTASEPFRKIVQTAMTQVLAQLNMPTRDEITSIAERLTNIEFRLDDLDAKIDALGKGKE